MTRRAAPRGTLPTTTLRSGKITTTGVLNHLKKHCNQVQIINGELEKVLNKAYKDNMQESDVILTVKLKADNDDELPLDFTFTKVEDNWRIARINRVNA